MAIGLTMHPADHLVVVYLCCSENSRVGGKLSQQEIGHHTCFFLYSNYDPRLIPRVSL